MLRPHRIGLDIGGTFTDLVLVDDATGALRTHKVLTTPRAPAEGALRGVAELCERAGIGLADVGILIHATTLVTNALIERRGAKTALLTTYGFRDTLEIGKEQRYDIFDLFLRYPEPLVPRRWRMEIRERITRDGEVRTPLDLETARARIADLAAQGVEAVAVVFLHAYKNSDHEHRVRDLIARDFPHLAVSISSEVSPEIREYERTCTTVCNAYVQPLVDRYLGEMEAALARGGFGGRLLLMLSSGTLAAPDVARRFPVRLLESGPAAGALVAGHLGREADRSALVSFDMGGTTAKVCLVRDGRPNVAPMVEVARVHRFKSGSGMPVKTPVIDMIEIGAGGGSMTHTDAMGLLHVGPESAGADPGPACYGLGGEHATVTDACVHLGYFDPDAFLGGTMRLDAQAAEDALARAGAALGLDALRTAWGIYAIVCENMAQAARLYLIERGQDPRGLTVMAFGGAGPAVAARVARLLGVQQVMIPPTPGVASALGLLVAAPGFDFGHSLAGGLDGLDWDAVERLYGSMEAEGRRMVVAAGGRPESLHAERRVEMRYAGQFHDIEVAVPRPLHRDSGPLLSERFEREYTRLFGRPLAGYSPQALSWRVLVMGEPPRVDLGVDIDGAAHPSRPPVRRRPIFLPGRHGKDQEGFVEVPVYRREALPREAEVIGPAIVEEDEATTLLWPGDHLAVDGRANLVIRIGPALTAEARNAEAVTVPNAGTGVPE